MRRGLVVSLALAPLACATPPQRAQWHVTAGEGIVGSNSRVLVGKVQPEHEGGVLVIRHPILLENVGRDIASVGLGHARAGVGSVEVPLRCDVQGRTARVVFLRPHERSRADCVVSLDADDRARVGRKDAQMFIHIPVRSVTGQSILSFSYQLWVDDLS